MRPSEALHAHRAEIRQIVASHHATNVRVFGSSARAEDDEDSDLDLLVDPTPETTLIDLAQIQLRLEALLGVRVDVLTPKALPETFRARVVAESVPV
ncbi:nucleotidyltransferase family protein [Paraburkholderia sacchari]|uniref:nucleotidyltransferase family protein n=1 Tax=Paraburkholderia sacchari TaxID=159450 RepID=UPI0005431008|nr:nucleotidyltransferase domain-containing protein [Paraburkholderia sacchari]NLP61834.1 nucleotidyltransferase [Paraburkholderia sacchari]